MLGRRAIRPVPVRCAAGKGDRTGYQLEPIIAQGPRVHFPIEDHRRQRSIKRDQVWPDLNRAVSMPETESSLRHQHSRGVQKRPDRIGHVEILQRNMNLVQCITEHLISEWNAVLGFEETTVLATDYSTSSLFREKTVRLPYRVIESEHPLRRN